MDAITRTRTHIAPISAKSSTGLVYDIAIMVAFVVIACDPNCATSGPGAGCATQGAGLCDSVCNTGYALNSTYGCAGWQARHVVALNVSTFVTQFYLQNIVNCFD